MFIHDSSVYNHIGLRAALLLLLLGMGCSPGTADTSPKEITLLLPDNVELTLVPIPAGTFEMGSPEDERGRSPQEGPVHTVTFETGFYMSKYEVTQQQWLALMGAWPEPIMVPATTFDADRDPAEMQEYRFEPKAEWGLGDHYPAYNVSWEDAHRFVEALNAHIEKTGQGAATVRLPSEAEWEYACRAGTTTRFYFGDSLEVPDHTEDDGVRSQYMWYGGNDSPSGTKPVGQKLPNAFGLHDMHGNLYEWCEDDWVWDHTDAPGDGSIRTTSPRGSGRVIRGGGWHESARWCRSARRYVAPVEMRTACIGFRITRQ